MAMISTTQTTTTTQPPTQTSSSITTTTVVGGTTPADVLRSLQQALKRYTLGGGRGGGSRGGGGGGGGGAPGAPQNAPQQPTQPPQDVKMMGALPSIFVGDQEQVDNLVEQIKGYIHLNCLVPRMNFFLDEFAMQFQDSQHVQRAMIKLKQLKMKWPNIDQYINNFEKLVHLAGYTLGNQETMGFFPEGLPRSVVEAILIPPTPETYVASKEKAIQINHQGGISRGYLDFGPAHKYLEEETP